MKNKIVNFLVTVSIGCAALFSLFVVTAPVFAAGDGSVTLFNPLAATVDPEAPVQSLSAIFINVLFGIAGSVSLAMFVWGGVLWLTSAGNEKQVTKGRDVIQWTVLGMIMMFASYTLVSYLFSNFGTGAIGSGGTNNMNGGVGNVAGGGGAAAAAGGTGGSKSCCVNYGDLSATTVTSADNCSGGNVKVFPGACETQKVWGCTADLTLPCAPSGSCPLGLPTYSSFKECVAASGASQPDGAPKPYCCYASQTNKGYKQMSFVNDDAAASGCPDPYDTWTAGKCLDITEWCNRNYDYQHKSENWCVAYYSGKSPICPAGGKFLHLYTTATNCINSLTDKHVWPDK